MVPPIILSLFIYYHRMFHHCVASCPDVDTTLCSDASKRYDEVLVVDNSCFLIRNTEVSWFLAREMCEQAGARLATIDSAQIQVGLMACGLQSVHSRRSF